MEDEVPRYIQLQREDYPRFEWKEVKVEMYSARYVDVSQNI